MIGELASLGAAVCWATGTVIFSQHGMGFRSENLNILKSTSGLVLLFSALIFIWPEFPAWNASWKLFLSGALGIALGDTALLAALARVGPHVTSAGMTLSSPMAAILALSFLGENLSDKQWLGVALATWGVLGCFLLNPRGESGFNLIKGEAGLGFFFAILAPFGNALGIVLARDALSEAGALWGTIFRIFAALVVLVALQPIRHKSFQLKNFKARPKDTRWLIVASFLGTGLGIFLMTVGTKYTKAGVAATLSATYPVWVIPIAWLWHGKKMAWPAIISTLLAVAGVGLLFDT